MDTGVIQLNTDARKPGRARLGRASRFKRARALWAPLVVLELYLAFTVFVFFFGPVDWDVPNSAKLLTFLAVNYGGLWLGYGFGIRGVKRALSRPHMHQVGTVRMPPVLTRLLVISMVFCILSTMVRLYAVRGGLDVVLATFLNPGAAYRESQVIAQMDRDGQLTAMASFSWAFRLSTVLSVMNGLYFPLALACWEGLRSVHKLLFFASLFCSIVFTVGLGSQNGIGILVFASLPVILYRMYVTARASTVGPTSRALAARRTGATRVGAKLIVLALTGALMATIIVFQVDRREDSGLSVDAAATLAGPFASPSDRLPRTSESMDYGFGMLCLYVSHGYEGLALAMELPFEWTYGLGWSKALQVILHDYVGGPDVFAKTYLVRNETRNGWPALQWWSTIFPWIASDTTFFGTVLVMLLVGFGIARCWANAIITGNPVAFAVLAQLFTLVFMIPANDALAQTLEGLFSLIGVLSLYVLSWRYFKPARRSAATMKVRGYHLLNQGTT